MLHVNDIEELDKNLAVAFPMFEQGDLLLATRPELPDQQAAVVYGGCCEQAFFTNTQGKHQMLDNANLLFAEFSGGRVLEISPAGYVVCRYIVICDDESVAKISGAERLRRGILQRQGLVLYRRLSAIS